MKLKLNDGSIFEIILVNGSSRYFQGANRDTLEIMFDKDMYPFEDLERIFSNKNATAHMTIISDDDSSFVYDDYTLRVGMSLSPVVIEPSTPDAPEKTEERVSVSMAQITYVEKQLQNLGINT